MHSIDAIREAIEEAADASVVALAMIRAEMRVPDADGMVDGIFPAHRESWADLLDSAKNARSDLDELVAKLEHVQLKAVTA